MNVYGPNKKISDVSSTRYQVRPSIFYLKKSWSYLVLRYSRKEFVFFHFRPNSIYGPCLNAEYFGIRQQFSSKLVDQITLRQNTKFFENIFSITFKVKLYYQKRQRKHFQVIQ